MKELLQQNWGRLIFINAFEIEFISIKMHYRVRYLLDFDLKIRSGQVSHDFPSKKFKFFMQTNKSQNGNCPSHSLQTFIW